MSTEFLKMNPKHEVPVFDHNGTFITESREIAKYFHENFNMAPEENDHWYPSDPEERKKVSKIKKGEIKYVNCQSIWTDKLARHSIEIRLHLSDDVC